jgi:putative transposase
MSKKPRPQIEHGLYHITCRGNARQAIHLTDMDRELFVGLLAKAVERCGWELYSYCLMNNHYHLLVRTPEANIATGMHYVNMMYARVFNQRHELSGHLFERRYYSVLVESTEHMLELMRYIALNPVRGGLCLRPEAWRWSSYPALLGEAPRPRFLSTDAVRAEFRTVSALRTFVNDGISSIRQPGAPR